MYKRLVQVYHLDSEITITASKHLGEDGVPKIRCVFVYLCEYKYCEQTP